MNFESKFTPNPTHHMSKKQTLFYYYEYMQNPFNDSLRTKVLPCIFFCALAVCGHVTTAYQQINTASTSHHCVGCFCACPSRMFFFIGSLGFGHKTDVHKQIALRARPHTLDDDLFVLIHWILCTYLRRLIHIKRIKPAEGNTLSCGATLTDKQETRNLFAHLRRSRSIFFILVGIENMVLDFLLVLRCGWIETFVWI